MPPIPEPPLGLDLKKFKIKYHKETGETVIKIHGAGILSELVPAGDTIDAKITVELGDIVFMSDEVEMTVEDRPNVILIEE
jgi:hypothetical protein